MSLQSTSLDYQSPFKYLEVSPETKKWSDRSESDRKFDKYAGITMTAIGVIGAVALLVTAVYLIPMAVETVKTGSQAYVDASILTGMLGLVGTILLIPGIMIFKESKTENEYDKKASEDPKFKDDTVCKLHDRSFKDLRKTFLNRYMSDSSDSCWLVRQGILKIEELKQIMPIFIAHNKIEEEMKTEPLKNIRYRDLRSYVDLDRNNQLKALENQWEQIRPSLTILKMNEEVFQKAK